MIILIFKCEFTKTYSGHCDQQVLDGNRYCFYHSKVVSGLIEPPDPETILRDLPIIKKEN